MRLTIEQVIEEHFAHAMARVRMTRTMRVLGYAMLLTQPTIWVLQWWQFWALADKPERWPLWIVTDVLLTVLPMQWAAGWRRLKRDREAKRLRLMDALAE